MKSASHGKRIESLRGPQTGAPPGRRDGPLAANEIDPGAGQAASGEFLSMSYKTRCSSVEGKPCLHEMSSAHVSRNSSGPAIDKASAGFSARALRPLRALPPGRACASSVATARPADWPECGGPFRRCARCCRRASYVISADRYPTPDVNRGRFLMEGVRHLVAKDRSASGQVLEVRRSVLLSC